MLRYSSPMSFRLSLLVHLVAVTACSPSQLAPPQCPAATAPVTDKGECSADPPQPSSGQQTGAWAPGALRTRVPVAISDPSGGLVEVTLTVTDVPGEVNVFLQGRPIEEVHYGVLALVDQQPRRKTRQFTFRAQGQKTYELDVAAFVTPAVGESGAWSVSWRYTPLADCYEPNDTQAQARRIPLDVPITAFAHPGIIEGDGLLVGRGLLDFYRFELTAQTTVRLAVDQPTDEFLVFELWDGTTSTPLASTDLFAVPGVVSKSAEVELAAGTWYVRVSPFVHQHSTAFDDVPAPAYWARPYTLTVERVGVVVAAGAESSGGKAVCLPTVPGPATRDDECVRYVPDAVQGQLSDTFTQTRTERRVPFGADDLGGGLFRLVITANGPLDSVVRRRGAPAGEEHGSGQLITDFGTTSTHTIVFRAQGFERYELVLNPFVTLAASDVITYQVSWTYEPVVDCYERNDTLAEARRIPLGRPITAFSHAGVIAGDSGIVGPSLADFYKVVLSAPTTVRLMARKPGDVALSVDLIDAAGVVQTAIDPVGAPNTELRSDQVALGAGTWFVRVTPFVSQWSLISSPTVVVPADWNQPYTLSVEPN